MLHIGCISAAGTVATESGLQRHQIADRHRHGNFQRMGLFGPPLSIDPLKHEFPRDSQPNDSICNGLQAGRPADRALALPLIPSGHLRRTLDEAAG